MSPLCEVGWKSLGVLELTALPSIKKEHWVPLVQEVDALLVGGGEVFYLCYWMWQSGLADLLPMLRTTRQQWVPLSHLLTLCFHDTNRSYGSCKSRLRGVSNSLARQSMMTA
jgi:hypothetical protein